MRLIDSSLRPLVAVCALSGALLFTSAFVRSAAAAPVLPGDASADQKKQAMDHFSAGKQAIQEKNYERAAMELRASLDVVDSPNARLELARTLREGNRLGEAWVEYGRVIETATKLAAKEDRYAKTADAATSERAEIEPKLAFVTVTLANAPPKATLKVSGRTIPPEQWSGPIVAMAGAVDVILTDDSGKELARQTVSASVGQKTPVSLDANPAAAPAAAAGGNASAGTSDDDKPGAADQAQPAPDTTPHGFDKTKLRPYAYVAGGVGVAGFAALTIFGLMSNSALSDLQSACPPAHGGCPPSANKGDEINNGKTYETIANIGLVAGIVGVGAGVTLFLLSMPPKAPVANAAFVVAPNYFGVKGSL
jgi:hypothetical protein